MKKPSRSTCRFSSPSSTNALRAALPVAALFLIGCQGALAPIIPRVAGKVFPSATSLVERPQHAGDSDTHRLWDIAGTSGRLGYLAEKRCQTRSGTFVLQVVVSNDLVVLAIAVRDYTAQRGIEVTSPAFGRAFIGKTAADPIRVGEDIDAITGATISCRSVADGVRELLVGAG